MSPAPAILPTVAQLSRTQKLATMLGYVRNGARTGVPCKPLRLCARSMRNYG